MEKPTKCTRFTFDKDCDMVLLRVTSLTEAHLAPYREVQEKWEAAVHIFESAHEVQECARVRQCENVKWRTLQGRFQRLVDTRRAYVPKQQASSGVQDTYGEYEEFIDDLICSIDDKKEKEAKEKNAEKNKKQELRQAGESVRESAVKRIANSGTSSDEEKTSRKKTETVRVTMDSVADKELELMKRRMDLDERRLAIEEKRVAIKEKQSEALVEALKATVKKQGDDA